MTDTHQLELLISINYLRSLLFSIVLIEAEVLMSCQRCKRKVVEMLMRKELQHQMLLVPEVMYTKLALRIWKTCSGLPRWHPLISRFRMPCSQKRDNKTWKSDNYSTEISHSVLTHHTMLSETEVYPQMKVLSFHRQPWLVQIHWQTIFSMQLRIHNLWEITDHQIFVCRVQTLTLWLKLKLKIQIVHAVEVHFAKHHNLWGQNHHQKKFLPIAIMFKAALTTIEI